MDGSELTGKHLYSKVWLSIAAMAVLLGEIGCGRYGVDLLDLDVSTSAAVDDTDTQDSASSTDQSTDIDSETESTTETGTGVVTIRSPVSS